MIKAEPIASAGMNPARPNFIGPDLVGSNLVRPNLVGSNVVGVVQALSFIALGVIADVAVAASSSGTEIVEEIVVRADA